MLHNQKKDCILCLYRLPDLDVQVFLSKLENCLNLMFSKYRFTNAIICGDFNIDFFGKSNDTIDLLDLVNSV